MARLDFRQPDLVAAPAPLASAARASVVRTLQQSALFREYREAFEATTGLPLVLRAAGSFRLPLQGSRRRNPFCALMTRGNSACLQAQQGLEEAASVSPQTVECHAGLSESVVPVRVGEHVPGHLQTGRIFLRRLSPRLLKTLADLLAARPRRASPDWKAVHLSSRARLRERDDLESPSARARAPVCAPSVLRSA